MSDSDLLLGPPCRECHRDEARCARDGGCCLLCTHEFGEEQPRPPGPRITQPCGTPAAHRRHRDRGETPCQPCADAMRAYNRDYTERKKASA
jgi:hypothetical protein